MMILLLLHAAATWWMVGLIWFVQVVHYPLFASVAATHFTEYATTHQRRTSWVVGPPMLIELATTLLLLVWQSQPTNIYLAWAGAGLLAGIWLSTALVQMRQHRQLANGFDDRVHRRLVLGNWPRTIFWSARGLISLAMIDQATSL